MKEKDILRLEQLDEQLRPLRALLAAPPAPRTGWIRTLREALGMTSAQLAKRSGKKAPQTIEDIQNSEITGAIKIKTLQQLAGAMGCRFVYALIPEKPLEEMRRDQARRVAQRKIRSISHSMELEAQGVTQGRLQREMDRMVHRLLNEPKKLWE